MIHVLDSKLISLYVRSLGDVGGRAQALLGKRKAARFVDKAKDSGEVVALVEELRQAIVIYQVCYTRCQTRGSLTYTLAGLTATVDIQSGCQIDREFPLPSPTLRFKF